MISRLIVLLGIALIPVFLFTGCIASMPTGGSVYAGLQSEDPAVRIQSAVDAGKNRDKKAIPLLVECLDDNESDVRMFAGMALKRIVGEKTYDELGWRFYFTRTERRAAVERWREWVAKNCGDGRQNDWQKLDSLFKAEKGAVAG